MDAAVKELLTQCYEQAVQVIKENRDEMDQVVNYLLEKETITGAEMVAILEGRDPALADQYADPEEKKPEPLREASKEPIPLGEGQTGTTPPPQEPPEAE